MKRAPTGPVTIRGIQYEDDDAAAAAFGISRKAVRNAINRGRQDFIGIPAHKTRKRTGAKPMQVRIAGKVYPSARAASEAIGVSVKTIYSSLSTGREDFVGLGKKRPNRKGRENALTTPIPVQIGIRHFRSIKAAAIVLRRSRATVARHVSAGDKEWLIARLMAVEAREEGHKPALPADSNSAATTAGMEALWQRRRAEGQGATL